MRDQDIFWQVARIHVTSIEHGFLPTLGEGFLALMYRAIDECESAVLFTEEDQGRVVGFVSGATCMRPVLKQMLKHLPRLVVTLGPIFLRPQKIWRIIEILRHSVAKKASSGLPEYELLSIAVLPDSRRKGTAQRLFCRLADHFRSLGGNGFRIIVGETLDPARDFYARMGAKVHHEAAVHGQEKSFVYVYNLKPH